MTTAHVLRGVMLYGGVSTVAKRTVGRNVGARKSPPTDFVHGETFTDRLTMAKRATVSNAEIPFWNLAKSFWSDKTSGKIVGLG